MTTKQSLVFVDVVEETWARLLLDDQAFSIPRSLLPDGVREGQWLLFTVEPTAAPPSRSRALRDELGRTDPGGDIKL